MSAFSPLVKGTALGSSNVLSPTGSSLASPPLKQNKAGRFDYIRTGPSYHDLWATVLFLGHFAAFVILSLSATSGGTSDGEQLPSTANTTMVGEPTQEDMKLPDGAGGMLTAIMIVTSMLGAALCGGFVYAVQHHSRSLIKMTFALSIGFYVAAALIMLLMGAMGGVFTYGIAAAITALYWFWWRSRLELSALIMATVGDVTKKYPATYTVALLSLVIQFVYGVWWFATFVGVSRKWSAESQMSMKQFLQFFLLVSVYWTSQVLKNTLHVTISGVVSSFYFLEGTPAMPANPTLGAAKRAFTTSFGSIAFGSLIVAILQLAQHFINRAVRRSPIACVVHCFTSLIERMVEYFNKYAFVHVAIYGTSFCDAGKSTWDLIKSRGVDAIINDCLVTSVLNMGVVLVAFVCGFTAWLWGYAVYHDNKWTEMMSELTFMVAIAAYIVGSIMMTVVSMVIESSTAATFVCISEEPGALARTKPELYRKFAEVYPQVAWNSV